MLDHTSLIHDVVSLRAGFQMDSFYERESTSGEEECALDFQWLLVDPETLSLPCGAEVIAEYQGQRWAGLPLH